jgi:hypothetical protein
MRGEFCSWFHKAFKMQVIYLDSDQPRLDPRFEMQLVAFHSSIYIRWLFWHYITLAYMIIAKQN